MKHGLLTIFRKELARFFGDKRMAFTTILLPGLLIFFLYTFMGDAMMNRFTVDEDYAPAIHAVNLPDSVAKMADAAGFTVNSVSADEAESLKQAVAAQEIELLAVFPADFDAAIAAYDAASGAAAPAVELYYNSADTESQTTYTAMTALLDGLETALSNKFDVNPGEGGYDLASQEDTLGTVFASMLPMLLMMFLFSGCMSVAPESIAGEKERGTIATLLVTPLKRSQLALGKVFALSLIALLAGASSTAGTLASLPKMLQMGGDMTLTYGLPHYLALVVVILSTVLLIVALTSIISAFAKSTKEAQTYITPLMILVTLLGITAMTGSGAQENTLFYLIPFYNSVQTMVGIFAFELSGAHLAVTACSNLVLTGVGVFFLTRMFNSERLMFQR